MEGLRQEVYTLQRELLQDRTKVKALSEELENPDNTYVFDRWLHLFLGCFPGISCFATLNVLPQFSSCVNSRADPELK